jgi:aryl-alcohol dehydrogenase-like predicted oxidoreductase
MHARTLGNTGILVTPIGLGLAALGRPGYINLGHGADLGEGRDREAMRAHCHRMLDCAWALGVRYFDAARSYGLAEKFLGGWLRATRHHCDVGSKWGYTYTADWRVDAEVHEVKEHSRAVLDRQWAESQEHLGRWLRLYQIHSATLDSGILDNRDVLGRLAEIKGEGVAIGLTLSGPNQAEMLSKALTLEIDGVRLFDSVQATWNLLEPSSGEALAEASEAGLGIFVKEALANGRLTDRNREPTFAPRRALLEQEAKRLDTTPHALALAAVLARPWADMALSGAVTETQLRANLRALDVAWDDEADTTLQALAEAPQAYWKTRSDLPWN